MRSKDEQTPIRERWTAQVPGSDDEATAGELLRLAALPCPVGEKKLAEIHARLPSSQRTSIGARERSGMRFLRQLVVAGGLMLLGGALFASVSHVLDKARGRRVEGAPPADAASSKPAARSSARPHRPAQPASVAEAPEDRVSGPLKMEAAPAQSSAMVHLPRPSRVVAVRETPGVRSPEPTSPLLELEPALAPPQGPSPLARESRLLASAIAKLRQDHDPAHALAILDQHSAEFGLGVLAPESTATRIEALLALGRNAQALALLDGQSLSAKGVGREMLVARAELRADKGRCSVALRDFDQLLAAWTEPDSVVERALYGRAVCRGKSGDWDGARLDFERYTSEFPHGRFAKQARAAMAPKLR
jgi:hypothetical protein